MLAINSGGRSSSHDSLFDLIESFYMLGVVARVDTDPCQLAFSAGFKMTSCTIGIECLVHSTVVTVQMSQFLKGTTE